MIPHDAGDKDESRDPLAVSLLAWAKDSRVLTARIMTTSSIAGLVAPRVVPGGSSPVIGCVCLS